MLKYVFDTWPEDGMSNNTYSKIPRKCVVEPNKYKSLNLDKSWQNY